MAELRLKLLFIFSQKQNGSVVCMLVCFLLNPKADSSSTILENKERPLNPLCFQLLWPMRKQTKMYADEKNVYFAQHNIIHILTGLQKMTCLTHNQGGKLQNNSMED